MSDKAAAEACPTCGHALELEQPGRRWCPQCEVSLYGYSEDFEGRGFEEDGFDV